MRTLGLDLSERNAKAKGLGSLEAQHKEDSRHFWEASPLGLKAGRPLFCWI